MLNTIDEILVNGVQSYRCPSCNYSTHRRDKLDKHVMKHVLQVNIWTLFAENFQLDRRVFVE